MRPLFALLTLAACRPAAGPPVDAEVVLHFAAINDFHGALYEEVKKEDLNNAWGGLPWLAGTVTALRAEHPDLVVLDGGDLFQGSWPVNQSRGMGSVEAYNLVGVDAAAVGNHEFDYGPTPEGGHPLRGALEKGAKAAKYRWLAANVEETAPDGTARRWQPEGIAPTAIIERNGVKIGLIGLLTQDTPQTTLAKNVVDLQFGDVVEAVRREAPLLRAQGAKVVGVVGHLTGSCETPGYAEAPTGCRPDGEIGRILTELPRGTLDFMVLGHAHTVLAERIDDTFVIESRHKGHLVGRFDLVVTRDGVDRDRSRVLPPIPLLHPKRDPGCEAGSYDLSPATIGSYTVTPSEAALSLVKALEKESGSLCERAGCAAKALGREKDAESEVGNVVADAMLAEFPEADFAVTNSGGLRDNLPAGDLRREHLQRVMPFENRVLMLELSGAEVELLFRLGSSGAHGILQVAGAGYGFDPDAKGGTDLDGNAAVEAWETRRLCDVSVKGAPLAPERRYKVVTTDFLYGGGDHLALALQGRPLLAEGALLRDALIRYVEGQKSCLGADKPVVDPASPRVQRGACAAR